MTISVIVATLNRPKHIRDLLKSLAESTRIPNEVVIVEQGNVDKLEEVIGEFNNKNFSIRLIFQKEKSASQARQRGVKESTGEVLVFLDDDMIIGNDYLSIAAEHLLKKPRNLGLTGSYRKGEKAWTIKRMFGVFFGVYSIYSRNTVLSSGANDYIRGHNLENEQSVEWLYGGNMVLRRKVFEEGFNFNFNFIRWSFGEDVMLTYAIHKKYPNSLYYLPELDVKHNDGEDNKMLNVQTIRMKVIYRYIFWRQEVYGGRFLSLLAYMWSQVGLSGLEILQYPSLTTVKILSRSYSYIIRNRNKILLEQVDYNSFILQN